MPRYTVQPRSEPTAADPAPAAAGRRRLGRGRSGVVYEEVAPDGRRLACKVFVPDRLSSLVDTLLTGAVNPYRWNRHAVECAVLRRRILERLVPWWFEGRVRLPETHGMRWDEAGHAYELRAELVEGRHAMLRHPTAGAEQRGEAHELVHDVLEPLQVHLEEAGFDGLLWQAGKGNPVASANFLRETRDGATARWVWIDAESGVPAVFSLNPWHQFQTYFPLCDKHRRWIFDDVDVDRLEGYVEDHDADLRAAYGDRETEILRKDVEALAASQDRWRALERHGRSVTSHQALGKISRDQAKYYAKRPVLWLLHLVGRACARVPMKVTRHVWCALPRFMPRVLLATAGRWLRFFTSQEVRERWASRYVRRRVLDWRERGFMTREDVRGIREAMRGSDEASYVADMGIHLAIKPGIKLLTYGVTPLLYLLGVIDSAALVAGIAVYGGATGRTLYTLGRTAQCLVRRRAAPWVALTAGLLPMVGNAAYPLQLLAATKGRDGRAARFLVHDTLSGVGRRIPIWGGRDTLFEHRFNAVARLVTRA